MCIKSVYCLDRLIYLDYEFYGLKWKVIVWLKLFPRFKILLQYYRWVHISKHTLKVFYLCMYVFNVF